jgi:hypothetical protein
MEGSQQGENSVRARDILHTAIQNSNREQIGMAMFAIGFYSGSSRNSLLNSTDESTVMKRAIELSRLSKNTALANALIAGISTPKISKDALIESTFNMLLGKMSLKDNSKKPLADYVAKFKTALEKCDKQLYSSIAFATSACTTAASLKAEDDKAVQSTPQQVWDETFAYDKNLSTQLGIPEITISDKNVRRPLKKIVTHSENLIDFADAMKTCWQYTQEAALVSAFSHNKIKD